MNIKLTSTIIGCTALLAVSCVANRGVVPSKEMTSFEVKAEKVRAISTQTSINIVYSQSTETSVTVECPDNMTDYVIVRETDGVLSAGFKSGTSIVGNCRVTVTVTSPVLSHIDGSSSSRVELRGAVKQSSPLEVAVSSSASFVSTDLTVSKLTVDASSSAEADFGKVNAVEIELGATSSADIVAEAVLCGSLDARASSAAKIEIAGSADKGSLDASSAGTIDAGALNLSKLVKAQATSAASIDFKAENVGSVIASSAGSVNRK